MTYATRQAVAVWGTLIVVAGACFWRGWRNSDASRMADPTPFEHERIREALDQHLMALADATRERYCTCPDGQPCTTCVDQVIDQYERRDFKRWWVKS